MTMSINPKAIADKVLELNEVDDYLGILNIPSTSKETMLSMKSDMKLFKKNYLKLSLIIHPDRMDKTYANATKAFQALVKAYEILSTPELLEEIKTHDNNKNDKSKKKMNAISRSNEGCYRTRVCCPRCQQPWSENTLDGNPTYFYTFLMTGLKQYTCSTCLCEFGCMTAIHKCPYCSKQFDYLPSDYHNKIICGNDNCKKDFGFMLYHASDRVIKDLKASIKEEQEKASRATEAKRRRAMRGSRGMDKQTIELSFLMGMTDICPRCGEDLTEMANDGNDDNDNINQQKLHLMHCTDTTKHQKYEQVKKKAEDAVIVQQLKKDKQHEVQSLASWEFLGGSNGQLWLLNEDQLKAKALSLKLDTKGDKDTLIDRIVNSTNAGPLLLNVDESIIDGDNDEYSGSSNNSKKKRKLLTMESTDNTLQNEGNRSANSKNCSALVISNNNNKHQSSSSSSSSSSTTISTYRRSHDESCHQDIPSNYSSFDSKQLRSIIASQGLLSQLPKRAVKKDMLTLLERRIFDDKGGDDDVAIYISD